MPIVPLRLYADFQHEPPATMQAAIQNELASLLTPIGWDVEWAPLREAGRAVSASLAVAHFKGACDLTDLAPRYDYQRVLGETHATDGVILPFTDIYCDVIGSLLAGNLESVDPKMREHVFGRAVARVLAHELYHILTGEKQHGAEGVAEAVVTPRELISNGFQFQHAQVEKLRMKLVPVLLNVYNVPGSGEDHDGPKLFVRCGCSGCHGFFGNGTVWGPSLRKLGSSYESQALAARLKNRHSQMYRRAEKLHVLWPSLGAKEISVLIGYLLDLNRRREDRPVAARGGY
jgi:hypothetical protein